VVQVRREARLRPIELPKIIASAFQLASLNKVAVSDPIKQSSTHHALEPSSTKEEEAE
jgi:hypothetical protein